MTPEACLVVRPPNAFRNQMFLRLDGPFEYPFWTREPSEATLLSPARACQYASILRAETVLARVVGAGYRSRLAEPAPPTEPSPMQRPTDPPLAPFGPPSFTGY